MKIRVKSAGSDIKHNDIVLIYDESGLLWASSHVDLFSGDSSVARRLADGQELSFELTEVWP